MKKTIEPIKVWNNGQDVDATILSIDKITVNLQQSADIRYSLLDDNQQVLLSRKSINMPKEQYEQWGTDDDFVFTFMGTELNLTITGDVPEPVVEDE